MSAAKAKPALLFGVSAAVCLVIVVVSLLYLNARLLKADSEYSRLDKQRKELKKEVESKPIAQLEEQLRKLNAQLAGIHIKQTEREYIPAFTKRIESVASLTGAEFKELRPREYRKGKKLGSGEGNAPLGKYGEYDITFRLSGPFSAVFNTIKQLGQMPQMVTVNDIDFKAVTTVQVRAGTSPKLDTVLDLTAFIMEGGGFPGKFVAVASR